MKVFAGLISVFILSLSSCATMSEDQCKKANWLDIGRTEGSQGLSLSRVAEHNKACSKYGIKADSAEYKKGYQEGVKSYCTPENGYEVGKSGSLTTADCPKDLAAGFKSSWQKGREEYAKEVAAQEELKKAKQLEEQRSAFFRLQARGGVCDASSTVGVCFVFSGTDYADTQKNQGNMMACRMFKGEFQPIGNCSEARVLGRCSIVKDTPQEYHLFYYDTRNVDLQVATKDCADPKSSIHAQGAGRWTPYPR
jgi:hypothetical protein